METFKLKKPYGNPPQLPNAISKNRAFHPQFPGPRDPKSVFQNPALGGTGHGPVPLRYQPAGEFAGKLPSITGWQSIHPLCKQAPKIALFHAPARRLSIQATWMEMPDPRSPETLDYPDTNASLPRSFPITNLAAYTIEYGADTNVQSALNLVYLLSGSDLNFELLGASDERFHIRGGNQQVPLAIAEHLKTLNLPVHTGMRLQAIRRRSDGTYQLTFDSHGVTHEMVTDLVVLTLPFAVLRTLDFHQAGFDALKTQAIEHLGRGHNGKLQLQFTQRLWNSPGAWGISSGLSFADTGYQNTWEATRAQAGTAGILNNYTGGSVPDHFATNVPFASASNPHVHGDAHRFLHRLAPVFPGLSGWWNSRATCSLPHLSPYFRCSYSYWQMGQYQHFAGYEGMRQGNIVFGGEHTSVDFQGYMEGGAAEGARAGQEILTQLGLG